MVTRWGGHHYCSMPSRVLDARPAPVVAKAVDPAEIRALFPGLRNTLYFNTSTMCVGAAPAREAYERAVERWSLTADDLPATMARLEAAGVVAAAPRGRIRLSVHLYNLEEEIERVVELLADGR
jgi:hypothetical protein